MREAAFSPRRVLGFGGKRVTAALGLMIALVFALDVWGTRVSLATNIPGPTDFFARWVGAQAYIQQGLSPYSDEVSRQIQAGIYGRPLQPGEDLFLFVYPFYIVFIIAPLALLPYPWAVAIWLALLEFGLLAALWLLLNVYRWQPRPGVLILLVGWTLLFYPHLRGILLGQFVVLVGVLLALVVWALANRRDRLAGVTLALTTIKPHVVLLVIPLLLLWALSRRRWRFMGAFTLTLGGLLAASFLAMPDWLGDFIRQVAAYPAYTAYPPYILMPVPWILTHLTFPALGTPVEMALRLALLAGLAWAWWREVRSGWASFHWTLGLTLIVNNLSAVRTGTTSYALFLLPLVPLFSHLYQRAGALALAVIHLALTLGLWASFAFYQQQADLAILVSMPLFMLAALFWGREALARPLEQGTE